MVARSVQYKAGGDEQASSYKMQPGSKIHEESERSSPQGQREIAMDENNNQNVMSFSAEEMSARDKGMHFKNQNGQLINAQAYKISSISNISAVKNQSLGVPPLKGGEQSHMSQKHPRTMSDVYSLTTPKKRNGDAIRHNTYSKSIDINMMNHD